MTDDATIVERFLSAFNYSRVTIQRFAGSKYLSTHIVPVDQVYSTLAALPSVNTFFMVNEGDGVVHEGKTTARSQLSVQYLSSFFIDVDECPLANVDAYLKGINLTPTYVVESSPNKYHLYFIIPKVPKTAANVRRWKATQQMLSVLGDPSEFSDAPVCDQSMTDHSKLLRVPTTYNHKKTLLLPHKVRIIESNITAHTFDEVCSIVLGHADKDSNTPETRTSEVYSLPTEIVLEGARHHELTRLLGHMLSKGMDPSIVRLTAKSFIREHFVGGDQFLATRSNEIESFIEYKIRDIESENKRAKLSTFSAQLDSKDKFSLPDEFYYSVPSICADLVKEICSTARYPIPSFTFATCASLLALLKQNTRSSLGHAPNNYYLCLAYSGTGKNYAQEVCINSLNELGYGNYITQGIASAKGIGRFLENNKSRGIIMLDESEGFFESLLDPKTPQYLKQTRGLLLELYTSTNKATVRLGHTANKKEQPITVQYPELSFINYGVVSTLDNAFNKQSVNDGLLQRIIVIVNTAKRQYNPGFTPSATFSTTVLNKLKEYVVDSKLGLEKQLNTDSRFRIIEYTPDARRRYDAYSHELDNRYNAELESGSGLASIFTRGAEQVGRLATALCDDVIDLPLIEWCIEFIDSRINAIYTVTQRYNSGKLSADVDYLLGWIAARLNAQRTSVTYREILRGSKFRNSSELRSILNEMVSAGILHSRKIDNLYTYSLGNIL